MPVRPPLTRNFHRPARLFSRSCVTLQIDTLCTDTAKNTRSVSEMNVGMRAPGAYHEDHSTYTITRSPLTVRIGTDCKQTENPYETLPQRLHVGNNPHTSTS